MNIKNILTLIFILNIPALSWMAKDYKEHIIVNPKECETIFELIKTNSIQNCKDSIENNDGFKYKAHAGFLSDSLEIIPRNKVYIIESNKPNKPNIIPMSLGTEISNPLYNTKIGLGFNLGTYFATLYSNNFNLYTNTYVDFTFYHKDKDVENNIVSQYNKDSNGRCHGPDGRFAKSELCEDENQNSTNVSIGLNIEEELLFNNDVYIGLGTRINSQFKPYITLGATPSELKIVDLKIRVGYEFLGVSIAISNKILTQ